MMSTMELQGRRTDASPSVKRYLWSPRRWAISLASLLVASCGHFPGDTSQDAPAPRDGTADAPVAPDAPPIKGLVAWYPMDVPITAGTVVDASGNGHDGTCDSDLEHCPEWIGRAYMFDGMDDWFHVKSAAELEDGQGFTITVWFNCINNHHACFVNKGYLLADDNSWQACLNDNAELEFVSTGLSHQIGGMLDTARWYHLALSWDGSTKTIYLDGKSVASAENVDIAFDKSDINIGSDIDLNAGTPELALPFHGLIADVRIYNHALFASQIRDIKALWSP